MPVGNLPSAAKKLFETVYDSYKKDGMSDEDAAKRAWGAIKRAGWHKDEAGEWVKKSLVEFPMHITKSTYSTVDNTMRWAMTASDTGEDLYEERMSIELYNNFVKYIEESKPVPEMYLPVLGEKSGWNGGMPYLSLSHLRSGTDGKNIPGMPTSVYVDGEMLKAKGTFKDTELGRAVFKSINEDKAGVSKFSEPIRVSIGFIDFKHSHGENFVFERKSLEDSCPMCESGVGEKTYLDGQLIHLAFTRKPARITTSVEVEKSMENEIKTRDEDVESIVGESLAQDLEVTRSTVLVERTDETPVENTPEPQVEKACAMDGEEEMTEEEMKKKEKMKAKSAVEEAFDKILSKIEASRSLSPEAALEAIQADYNALGEVIKSEFITPEVVAKNELGDILKALSELNVTVSNLATSVNNVTADVATLKSQNIANTINPESTVQKTVSTPRSVMVPRSLSQVPAQENKKLTLREIAERSVGLS